MLSKYPILLPFCLPHFPSPHTSYASRDCFVSLQIQFGLITSLQTYSRHLADDSHEVLTEMV